MSNKSTDESDKLMIKNKLWWRFVFVVVLSYKCFYSWLSKLSILWEATKTSALQESEHKIKNIQDLGVKYTMFT